MNRTTSFLAATVLISACAALAIAEPSLEGTARVIDGDTLEINGQRVRLWGIDAFEASQPCSHVPCGAYATRNLEELVRDQRVRCLQRDIDRYKRIVAQCFVDKTDLGRTMVLRGWAFDYPQYSKGFYKDEQEWARNEPRGAWHGHFQWPWDYRHSRAK